jgi:hypothetical protein
VEYRYNTPKIADSDKKADGEFKCCVCHDPISKTVANRAVQIPVMEDDNPVREKDAHGVYYDSWVPSGKWIVHDGVSESFHPQLYHFKCFRSMDDRNFALFL